MERLTAHAWSIVAGLVLVVAADWMVVARSSWILAVCGLGVSVVLGFVALAALDDEGAPSPGRTPARQNASAPSPAGATARAARPPAWVTGTTLSR